MSKDNVAPGVRRPPPQPALECRYRDAGAAVCFMTPWVPAFAGIRSEGGMSAASVIFLPWVPVSAGIRSEAPA